MNVAFKKVCAIIVTCNRYNMLKRCLETVFSQTYPLSQVIVMDNASEDETAKQLKEYWCPRYDCLKYVRMEENRGGAGGFSFGIKHGMMGNCEFFLLMDDDAMVYPDYVETLMKKAEQYVDVGCFSGSEFIGTTDMRAYGGIRIVTNWNTLCERKLSEEEYHREMVDIDVATFVGLLIRRSIVDKIGIPDHRFFIYYDDTDYCLRIRKISRILCVPSARIGHRVNEKEDVKKELQKEWRTFYLYRNHLVIYHRYVKSGLICYYITKKILYKRQIRVLLDWLRHGLPAKQARHLLYINWKGYYDAMHERLGKAAYLWET